MYQYNSGISFSYKWWSVEIEDYVLGTMKISFKIDSMSIYFTILSALTDKKLNNDPRIKSILEDALKESLKVSLEVVDVLKTNYHEKCKNEAINYIDNNLGDAISYAKKKNSLPYLVHFS